MRIPPDIGPTTWDRENRRQFGPRLDFPPMDQRQAQIRERAGLEESRLNQEFIEWLRKWGTPMLLAVALLSVAYALRDKWHKAADDKLDNGFGELAAVTANPN